MIRSYARDNYYIFLAHRVWWISSMIGLQSELVISIGILRAQIKIAGHNSQNHICTVMPVDECLVRTAKLVHTILTIPPAIQAESRICSVPSQVHPDRRIQNSQAVNTSMWEAHWDIVLGTAKESLLQSEKQQKWFTVNPWAKTHQGKIQDKKLT
jgi:hypothetical protein